MGLVCLSGRRRLAPAPRICLLVLPMLALATCGTLTDGEPSLLSGASPETTGSIDANSSIASTRRYARAWQKDQKDVAKALKYAASLRAIGSHAKALSVLRKTAALNPKHPVIVGEYGKQLAASGKHAEAQAVLQRAMRLGKPDWRLYSAQATVLDAAGHHQRARQYYDAALELAPNQPVILNNLGMSYALAGDLGKAESTLRKAMAQRGAQPKVRQNLALVLGLQGRFEDAKKVASADLPPQTVAANMAYLRKMMSQPDMWSAIKKAKSE